MAQKCSAPDPVFVLRTSSGVSCISFGGPFEDEECVLFSGSCNGKITIWSLKENRPIKTLDAHSRESVLRVLLLTNGKLLSHGRDGNICHWNVSRSEEAITDQIPVYTLGFCPIAFLQQEDDSLVGYQASADSQVNVVSLKSKALIGCLETKEKKGMVMHIKLFEHDKRPYALIGYEDGSIALWDANEKKLLSHLKLHSDPVMALDCDSDHGKAASGSADDQLFQFSLNIETDCTLRELRSIKVKSKGLSAIKVRQDKKIVAVGCWDGKVRIFGWKKLKVLASLVYHSETINSIAFSSENILACACKDGRISLWDIYKV